MDYIVIGLLIVLTSLVSAVLYACCVMSGKIDKLAEQRNVNEELEELKKEKELGNYQEKNNVEDCKRISEQP